MNRKDEQAQGSELSAGLGRWLNKMYANAMGFFWQPCPICGRMFGGHETAETILMNKDLNTGWCVCEKCEKEAARRNEETHGWTA
jgi:hypothetical protein